MSPSPGGICDLTVCIKGAGDIATGIAHRLYQANIRRIYMLETYNPSAVRRTVAFSEAVYEGRKTVEGVTAVLAKSAGAIDGIWQSKQIALLADPLWRTIAHCPPLAVVDAILAKKNLGTAIDAAPLVIGLGPGFTAGKDAHMVIETQRGHDLGRVLTRGQAAPNTGVPGDIRGYTRERVLRSPAKGSLLAGKQIGQHVEKGDIVARVNAEPVRAAIDGVLRGLIRNGTAVTRGLKVGDIDPRTDAADKSGRISDKSRAMGGAVLEAILRRYNR